MRVTLNNAIAGQDFGRAVVEVTVRVVPDSDFFASVGAKMSLCPGQTNDIVLG